MILLDLLVTFGAWAWLIVGLVLLALELAVPGGYFLWLGSAGIVTGLLAFVLPIDWPWQVSIFGALALIIVIGWTAISRRHQPHTDQPFLNRRADRYLGHEGIIDEPIKDGAGRLVLDDTIWRVTGPDLARGARVRVVGSDGPVLRVEAA